MESYQSKGKLTKRAFILQEYDFDIVHKASRVNGDVDGLNWNPSSNEEDTTKAQWHGDMDLEAISRRHVSTHMCILLGCSKDVPQARLGSGDYQKEDIKLEDNGGLDIHDDSFIIAYL